MPSFKAYMIALAVGLLVGVIYGLLNVRSPAPPLVALIGLLGILVGEQIVPVAKQLLSGQPNAFCDVTADCAEHLFGALPGKARGAASEPTVTEAKKDSL
jgi:XapX domain-containing protein